MDYGAGAYWAPRCFMVTVWPNASNFGPFSGRGLGSRRAWAASFCYSNLHLLFLFVLFFVQRKRYGARWRIILAL